MAMDLTNIKPAKGAVKKRKRLGIGTGSGHGGTSTRGHKGVKARSGPNIPAWFEGGQMPLQRRLPKRGFTNIHAKEQLIINVGDLEMLDIQGTISVEELKKVGRLSGPTKRLKVLGNGDLTRAITVRADLFSKSAIEKIQALGGTVEIIEHKRKPKRFTKKVKA
jgi:large subunit ribosomal protein L15